MKTKFKIGDMVSYCNEIFIIRNITDHYILESTKENTSTPVIHIPFGNEDCDFILLESNRKINYENK